VTGIELAERRSRLGLSIDQLAADLDKHVDEVRRWETVTGNLPGGMVRELEWYLANAERHHAIERAGIPPCPWAEAKAREIDPKRPEHVERVIAELEAHHTTCDICQRRAGFVATLPPLPPPPMSASVRAILAISKGIRRLPKWLRPAATGAVIVGGFTLVRAAIVLLVSRGANAGQTLLVVLEAVGAGAYGGAVGGFAYALVKKPAGHLGKAGPYVIGIVCMYAYLLAFGVPLTVFTNDDTFRTPSGWVIGAVIGTVVGLFIGHSWFRQKSASTEKDASA